jgi:hypothetical protein
MALPNVYVGETHYTSFDLRLATLIQKVNFIFSSHILDVFSNAV